MRRRELQSASCDEFGDLFKVKRRGINVCIVSRSVLCVHHFRPSQVVKLLEYHIDWCETIGEKTWLDFYDNIISNFAANPLTSVHVSGEIPLTNPGLDFGPWIYGLLALVQKPMDPDTSYAMRTLAALAKKQR